MKTAAELSSDKLRGGFYSPDGLVDACLTRLAELSHGSTDLRILEPSAGDGAFIRGLARHSLIAQTGSMTAVEVVPAEAAACDAALTASGIEGRVLATSFLNLPIRPEFDAAVGNPPYLRFQFVRETDRAGIQALSEHLATSFRKVANLWIPILLGALARVRDGGCFAFIVPAECLTGVSADAVRRWLNEHCTDVRIDQFASGSFPEVLQEVVILSGRLARNRGGHRVEFVNHAEQTRWTQHTSNAMPTWTLLTLPPRIVAAYEAATSVPGITPLDHYARVSVATVTGANDFFTIDDTTRDDYGLAPWARPLLARIRHADGLTLTGDDLHRNRDDGRVAWLFDAAHGPHDPALSPGPRSYLAAGAADDLPARYKCRIRSPWYQVPVVAAGEFLLSKRSHSFPRLVSNNAGALTTDTIYQGRMLSAHAGRAGDLVGSFHNSLTLLTAELFGRSFGGGVLELVPSEIRRLLIPLSPVSGDLPDLDRIVRAKGTDSTDLIDATDRLIGCAFPALSGMLPVLREAQELLAGRRLDRNRSTPLPVAS